MRALRPSVRALFAHRLRAGLALSSVSVGVAAVILIAAIGAGAQREVMQRMESIGPNLLVVRPAQVERLTARKAVRGFVTTLELEDAEAIAGLPLVAAAAPAVDRGVRVKAGKHVMVTKVLGTTPAFLTVRRLSVGRGRFFDADDDRASRRVTVLGARVAESLFGDADPVGREVRVRGVPFEVIGVLEAKGVLADGSDEDNQLLVPMRTAMRRVLNTAAINAVFISVREPAAERQIAELLRGRHGRDDFAVQNTTRFLAMQQEAARALTWLATGLAALALVVGGTGILALLMMSVRERTSEIGLRMAIGATPRDILVQFLFEATLLALGGWLLGLLIAAAGAVVVAFGTEWKLALPLDALLASAVMVAVAGIGFGAVPARKAARMLPMRALLAR